MEQAEPGTQQGPQRAGAAPPQRSTPGVRASASTRDIVTGVVLKEPPPSSGGYSSLRSCTPTAVSPKGRSLQAETQPHQNRMPSTQAEKREVRPCGIPRCNECHDRHSRRSSHLFPVSLFLVHMAAAKFKRQLEPALHQPRPGPADFAKRARRQTPHELRVKRHTEDIMYSYDHQKNHH